MRTMASGSNWIQDVTLDKKFAIRELNGRSGDCLFEVFASALNNKVTVSGLRNIVAQNLTDDIFTAYKTIWSDAINTKDVATMHKFMFMNYVNDLPTLQSIVKTTKYWGDEVSIAILEEQLRIKLIIFSHDRYLKQLPPCVEGYSGNRENKPQWYILCELASTHYRIVEYGSCKLFRQNELPASLLYVLGFNLDMLKRIIAN